MLKNSSFGFRESLMANLRRFCGTESRQVAVTGLQKKYKAMDLKRCKPTPLMKLRLQVICIRCNFRGVYYLPDMWTTEACYCLQLGAMGGAYMDTHRQGRESPLRSLCLCHMLFHGTDGTLFMFFWTLQQLKKKITTPTKTWPVFSFQRASDRTAAISAFHSVMSWRASSFFSVTSNQNTE